MDLALQLGAVVLSQGEDLLAGIALVLDIKLGLFFLVHLSDIALGPLHLCLVVEDYLVV